MPEMREAAISPVVAVIDTWTPSRRMQAAAAAERERVEREAARLNARAADLQAELATVQAALDELEHQRDVLNHFAYSPQPPRAPGAEGRRLRAIPDAPPVQGDGAMVLRGARIREAAVRVLAAHSQPEAPVHYRDWFELLRAQGFLPAGKDPLATFLTQIGRSPVVHRTTTSGMYVLDLEAPTRARRRLAELRAKLAEVPEPSSERSVEEIASARELRARLVSEMQETDRQLEEALRSLGDAEDSTRAETTS
jgi:hypothetical protein